MKTKQAVDEATNPGLLHTISPEEMRARKERVRKILGLIIGTGYGAVAGGLVGRSFTAPWWSSKNKSIHGAAIGAGTGAVAGLTASALVNKMKRYTQEEHTPPPQIHIVTQPSEQLVAQVEQAIKQGAATGLTMAHYAGMAKLGFGSPKGDGGPEMPPDKPLNLSAGAALLRNTAKVTSKGITRSPKVPAPAKQPKGPSV